MWRHSFSRLETITGLLETYGWRWSESLSPGILIDLCKVFRRQQTPYSTITLITFSGLRAHSIRVGEWRVVLIYSLRTAVCRPAQLKCLLTSYLLPLLQVFNLRLLVSLKYLEVYQIVRVETTHTPNRPTHYWFGFGSGGSWIERLGPSASTLDEGCSSQKRLNTGFYITSNSAIGPGLII